MQQTINSWRINRYSIKKRLTKPARISNPILIASNFFASRRPSSRSRGLLWPHVVYKNDDDSQKELDLSMDYLAHFFHTNFGCY